MTKRQIAVHEMGHVSFALFGTPATEVRIVRERDGFACHPNVQPVADPAQILSAFIAGVVSELTYGGTDPVTLYDRLGMDGLFDYTAHGSSDEEICWAVAESLSPEQVRGAIRAAVKVVQWIDASIIDHVHERMTGLGVGDSFRIRDRSFAGSVPETGTA